MSDQKFSRKERKVLLREAKMLKKQGDFCSAAHTYAEVGEFKKALKFFNKGGDFINAAKMALKLGKTEAAASFYEQGGDIRTAAELFGQIGESQKMVDLLRLQAKKYLDEQKEFLAAELFEKCGDYSRAADLYIQSGLYQKALPLLAKGDDPQEACEKISKYLSIARDELSEQEVTRLLNRCREFYLAHNQPGKAAKLYYKVGLIPEAAALLNRAGEWEKAVKLLQEKDYWQEAAEILRKQGQVEQALRLETEQHLRTGNALQAAQGYEKMNEYGQAANLYLDCGNYHQAGLNYSKAAMHAEAARAYEHAGELPAAAKEYEKCGDFAAAARLLEQFNHAPEAAKMYLLAGDFVKAGDLLFAHGNPEEAMGAYQKVPPSHPEYLTVRTKIIEYFMSQGLRDLAQKQIEQLIEHRDVDENTVALHYLLAEILNAKGDIEKAHAHYEIVVGYDMTFKDAMDKLKKLTDLDLN